MPTKVNYIFFKSSFKFLDIVKMLNALILVTKSLLKFSLKQIKIIYTKYFIFYNKKFKNQVINDF